MPIHIVGIFIPGLSGWSMANSNKVLDIFRKCDANGDGSISRSELEKLLSVLDSTTFTDAAVAKMMSEMDVNKDGTVQYEEFVSWIMSDKKEATVVMDALQPSKLPRWMRHYRSDCATSPLRKGPGNSCSLMAEGCLPSEIVEVIAGPVQGYVLVRLALTQVQGWVPQEHLHECPEGTSEHGRLSSENREGDRKVSRMDLQKGDQRFMEVKKHLIEASEGRLTAEKVSFITGHFLGETGMRNGPKETLFHGTAEGVVDSIVRTGFDDEYAAKGKFGPGLYFSPEALTSYGYGHELFLCEVSLGLEEHRVLATKMSSGYTWEKLLRDGKRSVQCHKDRFGQEERIVYHCTQCKPVYVIKVKEVETDLPRWLVHGRTDGIPKTSLRNKPSDGKDYVAGASALNGEIVEVVDRTEPTNDYIYVKLALSGKEGWIKNEYLRPCPEGTKDHGRLAADGREVQQVELKRASSRFQEVDELLQCTQCSVKKCHCYGVEIKAKRIWFLTGQYLGETGMKTGPKTTLFHGCPDNIVSLIAKTGFDDKFSSGGAFGCGLYFSPQSCKAFSYAQNYILICEVALGKEANRLTLKAPNRDLNYDEVFVKLGKRSTQCHAGAPFNHEECIVYHPTQCKPVYIVETTVTSPGGGV